MKARIGNATLTVAAAVGAFVALSVAQDDVHDLALELVARMSLYRAILGLAVLGLAAAIVRPDLGARRLRPNTLGDRGTATLLGLVVGGGAGVWRGVGSGASLPRVLGDELLYVSLGKSLARGDGFLVRGIENRGYGIGYPLFVAPFQVIANDGVAAYEALQIAQSLVMASAAIPVYFLARRCLGRELSLLCAALSVLAPGMIFTSLVMTEALFYPVFLWFCVVATRALEHPTWQRQMVTLGVLGMASAIRLQGVVLVGVLVTAILIRAWTSRGGDRALLRVWAPTWVVLGTAAAVAFALTVATDVEVLGAYTVLTEASDVGTGAVWTLRSIGALGVAVGLVALAVVPAGIGRLLHGSTREACLGALVLPALAWGVATVGHFSGTQYGYDHVHERNLITLVPLVGVVAVGWAGGGMPRPRSLAGVGALGLVASVLSLRAGDVLTRYDLDALSLLPWRDSTSDVIPAHRLLLLAAVAAAVVALSTRRRWVVPATIAVAMVSAMTVPVDIDREATRVLAWVDETVGKDADVLVVTASLPDAECELRRLDELALWTEFFNVAAVDAAHLFVDNASANLPSTRLTVAPDGRLLEGGQALDAGMIVIDARVRLVGRRLATLEAASLGNRFATAAGGLTLWELDGAARIENAGALPALRACEPTS